MKLYFITHLLITPSCQEWMIYECCYGRRHSPLLLPLRFYSLVWIITVTNSSCSRMAFWIEREGESASEREAAIERREAWEINSSELTLRGPGTAEYCSSGGEMGRWRGGRKEKNPYAAREMNLMISGGRGEDHHSLLLTIKIRLASTVSTLASVKAWQRREGGQPPRGCLRVCHVNYGDPTVPFTDCSGLKEIHNPFILASTVTDSISAPSFLYFGNLLFAVFAAMFSLNPKSAILASKYLT